MFETQAGPSAGPQLLANARAAAFVEAQEREFLNCRQRLILYLVKLNQALDNHHQDLAHALLNRFCDTLVDYLSAGHFQLFQRLTPAPHEYVAIESTTWLAVGFSDRYSDCRDLEIAQAREDLEQLAQVLCTRFELEDGMLAVAGHAFAGH